MGMRGMDSHGDEGDGITWDEGDGLTWDGITWG